MAQEEIYNIEFVQNSIIAAETTSGDGSNPFPTKKKRNLPGTPDPEAEVIALSPKALMATNRFLCEICGKGFQRDQNLQLHRRGHNLPWKLKQRSNKEPFKRVYVCPEKNCVHNHPSRALGDLTGIKKHFLRKHCEKKWKCDKCSKRYAVQYDWKAHSKACGTREYRCECGTLFSRRDSFLTHKTFCDALNEETARLNVTSNISSTNLAGNISYHFMGTSRSLRPGNNDEASEISQDSTCGFPLWMGNQITQDHDITYGDPSNNSDYELMNWVFGNKIDSSSTGELITSGISHPLSNANNKELAVGSSDELLVSIPSLYSTQQTNTNNAHQTLMSATALLQKAAQIGVTTTSADSSFFGSLGVKCINNNQAQEGNNFSVFTGFYSSNPISTSQLRNNLEKGTEGD